MFITNKLLCRLKNICNKNEYIKSAIPCKNIKCFYFIIFASIWFSIISGVVAGCCNTIRIKYADGDDTWTTVIRPLSISCSFTGFITVNITLLYVYIRGLHIFAFNVYIKRNIHDQPIDDRTHEIIIEASRYLLVFGICLLNDLSILILAVCVNEFGKIIPPKYQNSFGTMIVSFLILIEITIFLQTVYLSFKFGHTPYEKVWYCCDQYVKRKCEEMAQKKYKKRESKQLSSLQMSLLSLYDEQEMHHSTILENGNSSDESNHYVSYT